MHLIEEYARHAGHADLIRESKLKEKLQYTRGTIEQWDPESAVTMELFERLAYYGMVLVLGGQKDDDEILRMIQRIPEPVMQESGDNRASRELRTYGIGAQIIADLGIRKMRVLSAPWKLTGLAGFGLEVVEYIESVRGKKDA